LPIRPTGISTNTRDLVGGAVANHNLDLGARSTAFARGDRPSALGQRNFRSRQPIGQPRPRQRLIQHSDQESDLGCG
jgi:hypothetical protein